MSFVGAAATQVGGTLISKGAAKLPGLIAKASAAPYRYGRHWLFGPGRVPLPSRFVDRMEYDASLAFWARHLQTAAAIFSKAATCYSNDATYQPFVRFLELLDNLFAHPDAIVDRAWPVLNLVRGMFVVLRYDDDIDGLPALDPRYPDRAHEVISFADGLLIKVGQFEKALLRQAVPQLAASDLVAMFEECKVSRAMALARRRLLNPAPELPSFPGAVPLTTRLYQISGDARLQIKSGLLKEAAAGVRQSVAMAREAANLADGNKTAQFRYWDDSPYMQAGIAVSNAVSTIHMLSGMYDLLIAWDDASLSWATGARFRSSMAAARVHAGREPNIWHNSFAHSVLVWGLFCHHRGEQDAATRHLVRAGEMFRVSGDGYRAREVEDALEILRLNPELRLDRSRIMRMLFEMSRA